MLKRLTIKNVALIKKLELEFCDKLNILSGETGAGKSIIVDSIMLLLGHKYEKTLLRYGEDEGYVEGVFDCTEASRNLMSAFNIDEDDYVFIARRFNKEGRSDIRINGKIATTLMLKQLSAALVDIYGQNESQALSKTSEHLRILDYYVRHNTLEIKKELSELYRKYRTVKTELEGIGNGEERARNIEIYKYQIDEIENSKIKETEEDDLVSLRKKIAGVEKISAAMGLLIANLSERGSGSAVELVDESAGAMDGIARFEETFAQISTRLSSVSIELSDIVDTIRGELEGLEFNEKELDRIETRLEVVRSLKRKYGSYDKMQQFLKTAQKTLDYLENANDHYDNLVKEKVELVDKIYSLSLKLSAFRKEGAETFEQMIITELSDLGMKSEFKILFKEFPTKEQCEDKLSGNGLDNIEFYLSPNVGQPLNPLIKIISGGEMSRFMLALKVITSRVDDIPTMIFDEIDAGISGKIGQEVAKKLATISRQHQVLCVTHLPQIAAMADNHYLISKAEVLDGTVTHVVLLDSDESIDEVSRLSGAKDISAQSFENAKEMKMWSTAYKFRVV